ncbi:MAG TPA: hypothetical protein VGU45_08340 [Microvirga sp.]|jgi:phage shock protein A|nr:hypothetical protein [Microvirga sp.]
MSANARSSADPLKRLEEMRASFERLRTERIRAEGEVERLARELEAARSEAKAAFGTDDEGEIEALIGEARARNAALVDEFAALIRGIESKLQSLGDGR